jgi:hypothetical protein
MVKARGSHGNAYRVFISPAGWGTLAGGNTPGNRPSTLRPGKALESTINIRPICRIRPILPHPKSTVELGHEPLIRVENGLRSPLSPTSYRPKSGPKIRESNQNQTVTSQKIYPASLIQIASFVPFVVFCGKFRCILHFLGIRFVPYASHCQPLPAYPPPPVFFRGGSSLYGPPRSGPVTASRGQSRSVAPGRAWSRGFKKKKIVYFL